MAFVHICFAIYISPNIYANLNSHILRNICGDGICMTLTCTNMPTYMCRYEVYGNLNAHNIVTETAGINVINSD